MLARLLESAAGVFDDLVVVHDGPELEPDRICHLTEAHGGRFLKARGLFSKNLTGRLPGPPPGMTGSCALMPTKC